MYSGFLEETVGDEQVFKLQHAFGGQTVAAIGRKLGDTGAVRYLGNHPLVPPLVSSNKDDVVPWLLSIMSASSQPMKVHSTPVEPSSDGAEGSGGAGTSQEQQQNQPSGSHSPAKGGLRFLRYRDQIRGYSEGDAPRRMRQWLLVDSHGREHVAVDTTKWEPTKKRFTYEAVAPFSQVKPLKCRSQRDVLIYLDQFVPAEARSVASLAAAMVAGASPSADLALSPLSPHAAGGAGDKRRAEQQQEAARSAKKPRDVLENQLTLPAALLPVPGGGFLFASASGVAPARFIDNAQRRGVVQQQRMARVVQELRLLQAECGLEFCLSTTGFDDGRLRVLTSDAGMGAPSAGAHHLPAANGALEVTPSRPPSIPGDKALQQHSMRGSGRDRKRRAATATAIRAERREAAAPEDDDVAAVLSTMDANEGVYLKGTWRREPFPSCPLEPIDDFQVAADCGEAVEQCSLLAKLTTNLAPPPDSIDPVGEAPNDEEELLVLHTLPAAVPPADLAVQPVWGVDAYTRANLVAALQRCPQLAAATDDDEASDSAAAIDAFLRSHLLPALNALGGEGWDVVKALELVESRAAKRTQHHVRSAAALLCRVVQGIEQHCSGDACPAEARQWFRAHPKGEGVVVQRPGGLPAGAFLGQYLGELYCPWRWTEREQEQKSSKAGAVRRPAVARMGASPDFYNIGMGRPKGDARGFDVLYVNAVQRGNLVSRMSHSCDPNCRAITVAAGGRLTIGMWTTRAVAQGEELCIDFGGEAESEREHQSSVCLCGASSCRGTFLYPAPAASSPLLRVFAQRHGLPERCRLLLRASFEPHLTFEDSERLSRHGFKDLAMHDGVPGAADSGTAEAVQVPRWLRRWAALVLEFIEEEAAALPAVLAAEAPADAPSGFTAQEAAAEVAHQVAARVHALATTLDRAKLALRHQGDDLALQPPLRMLTDAEAAAFLWGGPESVGGRAVGALRAHVEQMYSDRVVAKRAPRRGERAREGPWWQLPSPTDGVKQEAEEAEGQQQQGEEAEGGDGGEGEEEGSGKAAGSSGDNGAGSAGRSDGCGGPAHEAGKAGEAKAGGSAASGSPLQVLLGKVEHQLESTGAATADEARRALRDLAALFRAAGPAHAGMHDVLCLFASTRTLLAQTEYEGFTSQLCDGSEGCKYRPAFLWGLLCSWHRHNGDPVDALLKERRGCLCLPDVEGAYMPAFTSAKYATGGERAALLRHLAAAPTAAWPQVNSSFTFRNPPRVFGSPQLDAVLGPAGGADTLAALVHELNEAAFGRAP